MMHLQLKRLAHPRNPFLVELRSRAFGARRVDGRVCDTFWRPQKRFCERGGSARGVFARIEKDAPTGGDVVGGG